MLRICSNGSRRRWGCSRGGIQWSRRFRARLIKRILERLRAWGNSIKAVALALLCVGLQLPGYGVRALVAERYGTYGGRLVADRKWVFKSLGLWCVYAWVGSVANGASFTVPLLVRRIVGSIGRRVEGSRQSGIRGMRIEYGGSVRAAVLVKGPAGAFQLGLTEQRS